MAVTQGKVAGEVVTVVTHTNPRAYALLESGAVQLKPGIILGPAPLFAADGKLFLHSEKLGISFLQFLGATEGRTGTWPLGCDACISWMTALAPGFIHSNPKN